jgi:heme/copper-type cytochrome/quinol oxidase subunit 2
MLVVILTVCALLAGGVFIAILLSIWSSRRSADRAPDFHQDIVAELVWAVIPCLMIIAAAIPAAIAIIAARNKR